MAKTTMSMSIRTHPLLTVMCLLVALTIAEAKGRILTIGVYSHAIVNGPNQTEPLVVAGVNGVLGTQSLGAIKVVDDVLRLGAAESSLLVGNVRGLRIDSGSHALTAALTFSITFGNVSGQIQVHGTDLVAPTPLQFSVVGGTGDFALARGVAYSLYGPNSTDAAGVERRLEGWNITLYQDPLGPKLKQLHTQLYPDLAWW